MHVSHNPKHAYEIKNQAVWQNLSDIQGSIAHRARLDWVLATASVETANVGKIFIIEKGGFGLNMCAVGYHKTAWTYHCISETEVDCWCVMLACGFQDSLCLSEWPKGQLMDMCVAWLSWGKRRKNWRGARFMLQEKRKIRASAKRGPAAWCLGASATCSACLHPLRSASKGEANTNLYLDIMFIKQDLLFTR